MSDNQTFVIVGGGLAGAKAAETLRDEGFDGRVVLVGDEDVRPYERPPLSKDYLRGEADGRPFVHDEGFYAERDIDLELSAEATEIDRDAAQLKLADGRALGYDRLLLATGAEPRRLPVDGADLDGVLYLRNLPDSEAIAERFGDGKRLVVIGAGWIGAEIAASARQKGSQVTMLETSSVPLERVLGREVGAIYRDLHLSHGVDLRPGAAAERFEGGGAVERVVIGDGESIDADAVVVGIGVAPRVELAERAGLDVDNGVLTDERLRTSDPRIFAAGDVANARHPFYGRRLRVEHWANALAQGPVAARSMLDQDVVYDEIPYFFSDQYDAGMEYRGYAAEWDEVVFRGDPAGGEFIAFWTQGGAIAAGMNFNVWDVNEQIRDLILSRRSFERRQLEDADTPLPELLG